MQLLELDQKMTAILRRWLWEGSLGEPADDKEGYFFVFDEGISSVPLSLNPCLSKD